MSSRTRIPALALIPLLVIAVPLARSRVILTQCAGACNSAAPAGYDAGSGTQSRVSMSQKASPAYSR